MNKKPTTTMTLYHGTQNETLALHIGLCLTPSEMSASNYGGNVHQIEITTAGLSVRSIGAEAWDRDNQIALGDDEKSLAELANDGVDIIVYQDEDPFGRTHQTYRIISSEALARLALI